MRAVAFSPDGRKALCAGGAYATVQEANAIIIWDVASRQELRRLVGHDKTVLSAVFSPDGEHVISGSADHTFRYWNVASGAELGRFNPHDGYVTRVAVSPDGETALITSEDKSVRLLDLKSLPLPERVESTKPDASPKRRAPSKLELILDMSVNAALRRANASEDGSLEGIKAYDMLGRIAETAYPNNPLQAVYYMTYSASHLLGGFAEYARAKLLFSRALALRKTVAGDDERVADIHYHLGHASNRLGQGREGIAHLLEAVRIFDSTRGPDFQTSPCIMLARIYRGRGQMKMAERFLRRVGDDVVLPSAEVSRESLASRAMWRRRSSTSVLFGDVGWRCSPALRGIQTKRSQTQRGHRIRSRRRRASDRRSNRRVIPRARQTQGRNSETSS